MPTTYAIPNGRTVMDATLYTGTGSSLTVNNTDNGTTGFKPDLVWVKSRSAATDHKLTDSVRGTTKALISDTTGAETTDTNGLTAFGTNGFTLGSDTNYNNNTATYVAWQWQAGQGTNTSNTSGSITSTVSVNATAGFSIVTWTSAGANATIGHGLGAVPSMIIVKARNAAYNWATYHVSMGNGGGMYLNLNNAYGADAALWQNTTPTSSVFSIGTNANVNNSGQTQVAYCWTPIAGFSAFGSYTGNGSANGPFCYTGFRPKFVLIKNATAGGYWMLVDSTRGTYNIVGPELYPNVSDAEDTSDRLDMLSNGFKIRITSAFINGSGNTMVYMAFAENPFKYANAR